MYVEYESNNSGGHWWLKDEDWRNLEKAGWKVEWAWLTTTFKGGEYVRDDDGTPKLIPIEDSKSVFAGIGVRKENGEYRFLDAMAKRAFRVGLSLREAADEWEQVTSGCATDAGCPCCGQPHNFDEYDDNGEWVNSGPKTRYEASW